MKVWQLILAVLLIAAGALGYERYKEVFLPRLIVASPAEGESWLSGENRAIQWRSSRIPKDHKIAISIRRIPPPPLQEEGQEFDPIIVTDVPNTGTTSWKISPMYPSGTYVLGITAYASLPITDSAISAESAPFTITHPKLAIDLYPLYPGASWNPSTIEQFLIGTTSYSGASADSATIDAGMNPASVITPFEKYYSQLMKERGWYVANDLAAGGHIGGQTGYRNGLGVILVRFHIDYQHRPENAPTECPCTVTFSLFSNVGD